MNVMMEIVRTKYPDQVELAAKDAGQVETLMHTALGDVPLALGGHVGRVLAQTMEYGRVSGWVGEAAEDSETFVREFLTGFKAGLNEPVQQAFPDRESVITHFQIVAAKAVNGPGEVEQVIDAE